MLFTDGDIVNLDALAQIDSEVAAVALSSKPPLVIEGPGSICAQAWQECGRQITAAQQMYSSYLGSPGMSGGHVAAVMNTGVVARNQARTRLNQIVATESQYGNMASAVHMWMAYQALALFYRDASARMKQDRLQAKYDRYVKDADFAWRQLRQTGLPYVGQPLEAPGAKHGVNAGTWTLANLAAVAGSGSAQTLQVAITYYDATRYVSEAAKGNAESGPSEVLSILMAAGTVLRVSIASLNPPTGVMDQVGYSGGAWTPLNASNWVIWCGLPGQALYWQAAVPIGTKVFTLAGDPVLGGNTLGFGQFADLNLVFSNVVGRG